MPTADRLAPTGSDADWGQGEGGITAMVRRLQNRLTRVFFRHFFRLLLVAVSFSEWGVLWWLLPAEIRPQSWAWQIASGGFIYAGNRWLGTRTQRRRRDRNPAGALPQFYYACAFTCLFCFAFLVLTGTVWASARILLGAIAAEARTAHAGMVIDSGVDVVFRWLADSGIAIIVVTFAYGYTLGQRQLRVTRLRLPLQGLPPSFSGFRIVHISDLHIGQNLDRAQLEHFVSRVNEQQPDLICITGDIIDAPSSDMETFLPILARVRAVHGVLAILGNHDHYADPDRVQRAIQALTPFTLLRDERTALEVGGARLHVVGLDDRGRDWARGVSEAPYLATALAGVPEGEPVLLLCHRPDVFPQAAAAGVALMLSGHTHGGQIAMPWFDGRLRNLAQFVTAYDRGLFERHGSFLYVNCGLGVTGQRIRLFTPREITVIDVDSLSAPARAVA